LAHLSAKLNTTRREGPNTSKMTHAPDYKKWDKFDSENDKAEANAKKDQFEANEDPMKSKVNGTPFNVLMQQAVKMKTAQTAPDRNKFDSWPRSVNLRCGLWEGIR